MSVYCDSLLIVKPKKMLIVRPIGQVHEYIRKLNAYCSVTNMGLSFIHNLNRAEFYPKSQKDTIIFLLVESSSILYK